MEYHHQSAPSPSQICVFACVLNNVIGLNNVSLLLVKEMAACDGASEFLLSATSPAPSLFNKGSNVKQPQGNAEVGFLFLPLLCSVPVLGMHGYSFWVHDHKLLGYFVWFLAFVFHSMYEMKEMLYINPSSLFICRTCWSLWV